MDIQGPERPKIEFSKVRKSSLPWMSIVIAVLAFILSNQELPVWLAIVIILGSAYSMHLILSVIKYLKYLRETERNHDKLMQLYGEKESESIGKDRIISSYSQQLVENFSLGAAKGRASKYNESLKDLFHKDINILEKKAGHNGAELILGVGAKEGVSKNMLLSIITAYGDDLWGVVRVTRVNENTCRGEVISKINIDFWRQIEKEMYYDASPPPHIKARLYSANDLLAELNLMKSKLEQKG